MSEKTEVLRRMALDNLSWRTRQNNKQNAVHIGENESLAHALRKCEVCYALIRMNKRFFTEAILKSNGKDVGRADIYVLDDGGFAIEITESEGQESIKKKQEKYPCRIVVIPAQGEFEKELFV